MFYVNNNNEGYWNTQSLTADQFCTNHIQAEHGYQCLGHTKSEEEWLQGYAPPEQFYITINKIPKIKQRLEILQLLNTKNIENKKDTLDDKMYM